MQDVQDSLSFDEAANLYDETRRADSQILDLALDYIATVFPRSISDRIRTGHRDRENSDSSGKKGISSHGRRHLTENAELAADETIERETSSLDSLSSGRLASTIAVEPLQSIGPHVQLASLDAPVSVDASLRPLVA